MISTAAAKTRLPIDVTAGDVAFGGAVGMLGKILPPMSEIPPEFKRQGNEWVQWQQEWFFKGLKAYPVPRDGIDLDAAMRNLKVVMGSWEPKHEHKQAGVAYLASLWFSSPNGKPVAAKTSA